MLLDDCLPEILSSVLLNGSEFMLSNHLPALKCPAGDLTIGKIYRQFPIPPHSTRFELTFPLAVSLTSSF